MVEAGSSGLAGRNVIIGTEGFVDNGAGGAGSGPKRMLKVGDAVYDVKRLKLP